MVVLRLVGVEEEEEEEDDAEALPPDKTYMPAEEEKYGVPLDVVVEEEGDAVMCLGRSAGFCLLAPPPEPPPPTALGGGPPFSRIQRSMRVAIV